MLNEHPDVASTKPRLLKALESENIISCRRKQMTLSTSIQTVLQSLFIPTDLKINYNSKDKDGGNQIHKVGEILTVKGLAKSSDFVCASSQKMEQSNDGSLKFHALEGKRKNKLLAL